MALLTVLGDDLGEEVVMRIESSVTSISWIPSEAMSGIMKLPMSMGVSHYDDPPPDRLNSLEELRAADRFRFANELKAWIDVEGGKIVDAGYNGAGLIGATTLRLGFGAVTVQAVPFHDLKADPIVGDDSVRFVQTAGGRTGAPMPRLVKGGGVMKITAPTAWTTLALTINSDGTSSFETLGTSPFPRHWIYDASDQLAAKSGLIDYKTWAQESHGDNTPWGASDSPAVLAEVESALEREISLRIMRGGSKPSIEKFPPGEMVIEQGKPGHELFLVLDGLLEIAVDGSALAQVGPGSVLGERALLEGGNRTSTVTAVTAAKVAVVDSPDIEPEVLAQLAEGHKREDD